MSEVCINCTKLLHVSTTETRVNCMHYLDEAHFHWDWVVDKQKVCLWAMSNPRIYPEKCVIQPVLHCVLSYQAVSYLVFLLTEMWSLSGSWAWCITVYTSACCYRLAKKHWFMQVHTTHSFLHNALVNVWFVYYSDRLACDWIRPLNSLEINHCELFIWGFVMAKLLPK
jgi:hypothetical protein